MNHPFKNPYKVFNLADAEYFSFTSRVTLIACDTFVSIYNTTTGWQCWGLHSQRIAAVKQDPSVNPAGFPHPRVCDWVCDCFYSDYPAVTARSSPINHTEAGRKCSVYRSVFPECRRGRGAWLPSSIRTALCSSERWDKPRGFNLSTSVMREQY